LEALEERQRHCIDIIRRTLPLLALQFPADIRAGIPPAFPSAFPPAFPPAGAVVTFRTAIPKVARHCRWCECGIASGAEAC
jgi:hypothetical protein